MSQVIPPLRGLILGLDTIKYSHYPDILRERRVIENPTDERLATLQITADIIDQCLLATIAPLNPLPSNFPATISDALHRAINDERTLSGQRWLVTIGGNTVHMNFSDYLPFFLIKHKFSISEEVRKYLSSRNALGGYATYGKIATILKSAGVPVYYISEQKGPEHHSVWTTP